MRKDAIAWVTALLTLVVLDGVWLGVIMKGFVREQLGPLLLDTPRWGPAALFYLLYAAGIWFFAVRPSFGADDGLRAAGLGAALGFIAYMTYDLTNTATLRGWSVPFSWVDVAWGTLATALAAFASFRAARAFGD
jgi:uncharacterized membrane protein